ncbi:MAG: hypothetical protein U0269_38435 [Polyangiales bacterium]
MSRRKAVAFVSWLALGASLSSSYGGCWTPVDYCYCALVDGSLNAEAQSSGFEEVPPGFVLVRGGIENGCSAREFDAGCVQVTPPGAPAGPLPPPELDARA